MSIIIPMYNGKEYIKKNVGILCSINCEKEIIIVDDGSTDNSYDYCCDIFADNPAVTVYMKENGGISSARNYGLKKATAQYLMFVDQDDYIDAEVVSYAYKKCRMNALDGIFWSCNYDADGRISCCDIIKSEKIIQRKIIKRELIRALVLRTKCNMMSFVGHIWAGIYKKEIIDAGVEFNYFVDYEDDQLFVLDFLIKADTIGLIPDVGYYWSVNPRSYSRNHRQLPDLIKRYEVYFDYIKSQTKGLLSLRTHRELEVYGCQLTLCEAVRNSGISEEYRNQCSEEIKEAIKKDNYKTALRTRHPYIKNKKYILFLVLLKLGLVDLCIFGTSVYFKIKHGIQ